MKLRKIILIAVIAFIAILLIAISGIFYVTRFLPKSKLKEVTIRNSGDRISHGNYLANAVMMCIDCHSLRDWDYFSGPVRKGTEGQGGQIFDEGFGLPGRLVSPNITPYGLKNWTDAELFRAITQGITKENKPLFPLMPYLNYGKMDKEDIYDVIAYIRSLPELTVQAEKSKLNFPVNIFVHLIPEEPAFTQRPDPNDSLAMGNYLVTASSCIECHTVFKKGKMDLSNAFAGGRSFRMSDVTVFSANITPSAETGIGNWTADAFVARFKAYDPMVNTLPQASATGFNTIMPWSAYAAMSPGDLKKIFLYLKSLKPIEHKVQKFVKS